jgi:hypothetical protein
VRLRERVSRISGIHRVYSEIDPQARAAYTDRLRPQVDRDG